MVDDETDPLEKAIRTLRKLPPFVEHHAKKINFEWPTAQQILDMPRDKSFKVSEILYQVYRQYPDDSAINSLGLVLENGCKSPMFKGTEKDLTPVRRVKFADGV